MKIAVDCRYLGKSGIGRVCEGILDNLDYSSDEYYLIGDAKKLAPYTAAHVIEDAGDPFSVRGMLQFPKQVNKVCDCIIIPNFIIPFGFKIPVYPVMHDLIFLDMPEIMTRGKIDYLVKKTLLRRCMKRAKKIACVSEFTRSRCGHYFPKYAAKCYVNHIGLSKDVLAFDATGIEKRNTIVYVGNVKPHKGLDTLIEAYKMLPSGQYRLKIIGEREGFLTGMKAEQLDHDGVIFTGRLSDEDLLREIASASFLVQPSLYEGFGLPPLEALYLGTQPIVSDIPVFKEVYGDLPVIFFKTGDAEDLKNKIVQCDVKMIESYSLDLQEFSYNHFVISMMRKLK